MSAYVSYYSGTFNKINEEEYNDIYHENIKQIEEIGKKYNLRISLNESGDDYFIVMKDEKQKIIEDEEVYDTVFFKCARNYN